MLSGRRGARLGVLESRGSKGVVTKRLRDDAVLVQKRGRFEVND